MIILSLEVFQVNFFSLKVNDLPIFDQEYRKAALTDRFALTLRTDSSRLISNNYPKPPIISPRKAPKSLHIIRYQTLPQNDPPENKKK